MDALRQKIIDDNLREIRSNIGASEQCASRPLGAAALMAVTKTVPVEEINYAIKSGIKLIGENKVQELLDKYDRLDREGAEIHFIGHLQTNKVKYIIDKVSMIQSVDSMKLAREIDRQAEKHGLVMDVLLEINVGDETTKNGVGAEDAVQIAAEMRRLGNINLRGLMCIPPICDDKGEISKYFLIINQIYIDIFGKNIDNDNIYILSYGMSGDYETAIECGSTMVRLGQAIFGKRDYRTQGV